MKNYVSKNEAADHGHQTSDCSHLLVLFSRSHESEEVYCKVAAGRGFGEIIP
jgi:hypothetical protein